MDAGEKRKQNWEKRASLKNASSAFLAKKEEVHLAQWGSETSWVTGGLGRSFLPPPPPTAITFLPAQDTQYQVEDEEGTQQNEGDKIDPGPLVPNGIVDLIQTKM